MWFSHPVLISVLYCPLPTIVLFESLCLISRFAISAAATNATAATATAATSSAISATSAATATIAASQNHFFIYSLL